MAFEFNNPLLQELRGGNSDSPYIDKNNLCVISNGNKIVLDELPSEDYGVTITLIGTAQAGANTSITLTSSASATNDRYNNFTISITGGTGAGQSKVITDYVGATKIATVSAWTINPDNTSVYSIACYNESQTNVGLSINSFYVNYLNSIITFNSSEAGQTVLASYKGRGVIQFPANRVYVVDENGNPISDFQAVATDAINETVRQANEVIRIENEDVRILSEQSKNIAEPARESAESLRIASEIDREEAEDIRLSSEITRQSQEGIRQSQESTRVSQEANRQATYTTGYLNWLAPVANFAALSSTYPSATLGQCAQTLDNNQWYRYSGSTWEYKGNFSITGAATVVDLTAIDVAKAAMIRNLRHSGCLKCLPFTTGSTTNLNSITVPADTYSINGYEVSVPSTVVTLPDPPTTGSRVDLVFLEFWFPQSGSGYTLSYRFRTVSGVNITTYPEGLSDTTNVKAWGGNLANTTYTFAKDTVDLGIFKSGDGSTTAKNALLTYDGYVYSVGISANQRRNSSGFSPSNYNGAKNYYALGNSNSLATTYTGSSVTITVPSTTGMAVGDIVKSSTNYFTVTAVGSGTQFTATYTTPASSVSGVLALTLVSDRPEGLYANVIDTRDIPYKNDLRHRTQEQYNFDYQLKKASDQFMRGELSPTKMLKTYHGIPKTEIDDNTVFYASLDGTLVPEVGGVGTFTGTPSYKPMLTGSGVVLDNAEQILYPVTLTNTFTVDVWYETSLFRNPPTGGILYSMLFDSGTSSLGFCKTSTPNQFQFLKSSSTYIAFTAVQPNSTYIHVRFTYNNGTFKIYFNDTLVLSTSLDISSEIASFTTFRCGHSSSGAGYTGCIADISISNIDRGSLFYNLPANFISGDAQIMRAFTDQRRILSQSQMNQTVNSIAKINNASGTSRGLVTNTLTGNWSEGVLQVETATVVGTITTAGNATVIVTANGMTGTPKTVSVAVALSDTADLVAGKIRTALGLDADISAKFTISGATTAVILTAKTKANNDTTLNISIANGTCVGLTSAPTSTNTTAGVVTSTITITGMAGEIISGVFDTDTALANVNKDALSTATDIYLDTVTTALFADADIIKFVNRILGTVLATGTIATGGVDITNKKITLTGQIGVALSKYQVVAMESTATSSMPKVTFSETGTAQAGAATTITLATGASTTDDRYNGCIIYITAGTGSGQSKTITDYVGSTKVAAVTAWTINPDATSIYKITGIPVTGAATPWANTFSNVATFTLGTNSTLAAQDIQIDYSMIMPSRQNALSVPTTLTLGGEAGFKVPYANQTIVSDYTGKIASQTWENPNIAKTLSAIVANNPAPSTFSDELITSEYAKIYTQDGIVTTFSTSVNGEQACVLLSFDLIKNAERKLGCKIPAVGVTGKIAWLKSNLSSLTAKVWCFGSSPTGNKATTKRFATGDSWYNSVINTASSPTSITNTSGTPDLLGYIGVDGFIYFLCFSDPSDGVTPSTINVDFASLDIKFSDKIVNLYQNIVGTSSSIILRDDFANKLKGDTSSNPNVIRYKAGTIASLNTEFIPGSGTEIESTSGAYNYSALSTLNATLASYATSESGKGAGFIKSYNIVAEFEQKYGTLNVIDKVAYIKAMLGNISCNCWCYGNAPITGVLTNKVTFNMWRVSTGLYSTYPQVSTSGAVTRLNFSTNLQTADYIDANGFVHVISYADASDGTTASTVFVDYCNIELTLASGMYLSGYDILCPSNPRRDGGLSNVLLASKNTKEVVSLFNWSNEYNLTTYSDYLTPADILTATTSVTVLAECDDWTLSDIGSSTMSKTNIHHWGNIAFRANVDNNDLYSELGYSLVKFAPDSKGINVGSKLQIGTLGFVGNFWKQYALNTISKPMVALARYLVLHNSEIKLFVFSKYSSVGGFVTDGTGVGMLIPISGKPLSRQEEGMVRANINTSVKWATSELVPMGYVDKTTSKLLTTGNSI